MPNLASWFWANPTERAAFMAEYNRLYPELKIAPENVLGRKPAEFPTLQAALEALHAKCRKGVCTLT